MFLLIFFFGLVLHGQSSGKNTSGKTSIDIIKVYEQVLKDGYESPQIFEILAEENYRKKRYAEAKKWFEKWFAKEDNPKPIAYLYFAKTLEALESFDDASNYRRLYEKKSSK